ncbi:5-(carboxyamino)imidazole ribonucleotide synthase [Oceanibacterium hippocampi]|uniref:N5-carboxyaminoimidazole ribonucleotide synthase n=1 Tax=Oceanibacterium hippocampi TaxID=745714 RepID=A0A1Y5S9M6_9PROT|nr:5-(carboxyamino)imidazole ribonucleotide synthase [Oceanibacterium hippocampi]SLN35661.1 N5-carboxyaminoimidazole ribonucleotide synthase [Oceanibacterium hippocampi]
MTALPPGSTIGILGGGQLGRMMAIAAAEMGYRTHIFAPEADPPAAQVANETTRAGYDDEAALDRFAAAVDAVTLEFENIPVAALARLGRATPVRPGPSVLAVTQDRLAEKDFLTGLGLGTAPYRQVDDAAALDTAIAAIGTPAILKTRRLGYDGKGQAAIRTPGDAAAAWEAIAGAPAILEGFVDFRMEVSVVAARGLGGEVACFVAVENRHRDHILDVTIAPAPLDEATAAEAVAMAGRIVTALDLVGLLAVEMFVTGDGRLLVNELAPRPHNSGHWTIEGCVTSQFRQAIRAVAGLPLGSPDRHANAVMRNLLGDEADDWAAILADPKAALHIYGKGEARPGRKMGHVTWLFPLGETPDPAACGRR